MVMEIGANTIRLGHYPFDRYSLERINQLGLVAWAELPVGLAVTTEVGVTIGGDESATSPEDLCPMNDASDHFMASARQQLRELIRQQYNHASVAIWALGNETTYTHKDCELPWYDNISPVFEELQDLAEIEDPSRPTTYADMHFEEEPPVNDSYIDLGGITDLWARKEYPMWYGGPPARLAELLDAMRARYPNQPLGVSEYGAGAAITHHTDNVHGGPAEAVNPGVPVVYQPEEYASHVHEQIYAMLTSRDYLYGTYVWNMFDFATALRNEGDVYGVNTKGIVTFDRQTRKDPFFFYKAQWNPEPMVYITSRRYTDRAYPTVDVKVYSNADTVDLSVNGRPAGSMPLDECLLRTCVFRDVRLDQGANRVEAVGRIGGETITDAVDWSLNTTNVNIAAGQIATGFTSSSGERFGSDNYFIGGSDGWLIPKNFQTASDTTPPRGTDDPDLFKNFRRGAFSYFIPVSDGTYSVTLGFLEPYATTEIGQNVFDVIANGETVLRHLDVLREAAGEHRTVVSKTFPVEVTGGFMKLDFTPVIGDAVVSNLSVRPE